MGITANINEKANLIWAIADKLTGVYKPHEYGEVILSAIIDKLNERFGTEFSEQDKVLE